MTEVCEGVAHAMGATASTSFDDVNYGFPATINTAKEAALAAEAARKVVPEGVLSGDEIMTMGGEDFSYYLHERPGCFVFVGSRKPGTEIRYEYCVILAYMYSHYNDSVTN